VNFIKLCREKIHRTDIRFIALGFGNFIFTDVNKRTSRLAANIPFIRALCPLTFLGVPEQASEHYVLRKLNDDGTTNIIGFVLMVTDHRNVAVPCDRAKVLAAGQN